jgi:hypothetical protein
MKLCIQIWRKNITEDPESIDYADPERRKKYVLHQPASRYGCCTCYGSGGAKEEMAAGEDHDDNPSMLWLFVLA